ncbi:hypothetical protein CHS0354_007643 [Potamilus streckersoni]|uniref:Uncharacterized protein n=1 Tax=Potamilus streckersoni TaxID=2493646 RepID=A0AAE0SHH4_9BIVA|nr:hypothetical protein CHS0354_007643 [Potamilus streckersoni]
MREYKDTIQTDITFVSGSTAKFTSEFLDLARTRHAGVRSTKSREISTPSISGTSDRKFSCDDIHVDLDGFHHFQLVYKHRVHHTLQCKAEQEFQKRGRKMSQIKKYHRPNSTNKTTMTKTDNDDMTNSNNDDSDEVDSDMDNDVLNKKFPKNT